MVLNSRNVQLPDVDCWRLIIFQVEKVDKGFESNAVRISSFKTDDAVHLNQLPAIVVYNMIVDTNYIMLLLWSRLELLWETYYSR